MTFRYYYKDPDGDLTEITGLVRENTPELVVNADEGGVGSGNVTITETLGAFSIRGHRLFLVQEDEATADDYNGIVYVGYTFDREWGRNVERGGSSRDLVINLVDLNTLLTDRIQHGKDVARGEETDIERVGWLLTTAELGIISDSDEFVNDDGADPEDMDKTDYDGQNCLDILDDCSQQSGRNYFVTWRAGSGLMPELLLWYQRDESDNWRATAKISNRLDHIDYATIWPMSFDAKMRRDPSRVYSNIREEYDGGFVNESKESTAARFRRRWTTGRAELVKTAKKARRRAKRTLNDIDTELDTVTVSVLLPRANVNDFMPGMNIQFEASHLPGYTDDYHWMFCTDRTLTEINPELVNVALTLVGEAPGEGPTDEEGEGVGFATLDYVHQSNNEPHVWFEQPGDTPPVGWPGQPTTAPVTPLLDGSRPANRQYYGWSVDSDFTGDIYFFCSTACVQTSEHTQTWAILVNGAAIGSASVVPGPGFRYVAEAQSITVTGYDFVAGDIIEAYVNCAPLQPFFRVPAGTGGGSQRLTISNAS